MSLTMGERRFAARYAEITANAMYRRLQSVPRHGTTNTFEHSIRVAAMSERMARRFSVDPESAARVGLLHDFCLDNYYDRTRARTHGGTWYCFYHPEDAVQNSLRQGISLTRAEKQAILSHMFPLTRHMLKNRLGLVLTLADKRVAAEEGIRSAAAAVSKLIKPVFRL